MKTVMKKILIISLIASIGIAGFGCSSGKGGDDESSVVVGTIGPDDIALKQELAFSFPGDAGNDSLESTDDSMEETEGSEQGTSDNSTAEPETEIVTEYVNVTDADGQNVTEADGQPVTEMVTKPVEVPKPTESQKPTESEYKAVPDICQAYFLDMTKRGDFVFDGEFLVLEFQIKEGTPDGVYPVTIDSTDIANWDTQRLWPTCIAGEVVVGNAQSAKTEKPGASDFTLDVDSVKGKPGDTVQLKIHANQNPGFCGFIIRIQYDSAALEVVDSYGGADFDQAVNLVD